MSLARKRDEELVNISPPDTIGDGSKDVVTAGTALQLSSTSQECRFVNIFAKAGNTGNVFVGGNLVSSSRGMVLEQARSTDWFGIDNLNKVYVDAANSGDGVQYCFVV